MEKETMSFRYIAECDRCAVTYQSGTADDNFAEFEKRIDGMGWTAQEFGHTCPACSYKLQQVETMDDSAAHPNQLFNDMVDAFSGKDKE